MSLSRILNMVIRQVIRIAVNKGVGAGIKALSKRGKRNVHRNRRPAARRDQSQQETSRWD
jgi:hypothetical protein